MAPKTSMAVVHGSTLLTLTAEKILPVRELTALAFCLSRVVETN
jgi:hypothetical protein